MRRLLVHLDGDGPGLSPGLEQRHSRALKVVLTVGSTGEAERTESAHLSLRRGWDGAAPPWYSTLAGGGRCRARAGKVVGEAPWRSSFRYSPLPAQVAPCHGAPWLEAIADTWISSSSLMGGIAKEIVLVQVGERMTLARTETTTSKQSLAMSLPWFGEGGALEAEDVESSRRRRRESRLHNRWVARQDKEVLSDQDDDIHAVVGHGAAVVQWWRRAQGGGGWFIFQPKRYNIRV
ncbi:hypothetical protein TRIUR3_32548 [Triticum urartu]|uniref:Uncharacterized protein n=1 Tax=Triticum urartu TaxID=4572 RepID=M7Z8Z6_TRIUA|nr:hypothetical protein TRIUR3_32548 [Triticum urartu]